MEQSLRNRLYNTVVNCRRLLEDDFGQQLEGTYGLHADGTFEPLESLSHLDAVGQADRRAIEAYLEHQQTVEMSQVRAYERYVRESSFTFLNRLAALKLMEDPARALIQPTLNGVEQAKGFQQFAMLSQAALHGEGDRGYRLYLELLFDDLSHALGAVFDRTVPTSILFPTTSCLQELLALLNDPDLEKIWGEDETIGWVYQYFTPEELREEARSASSAPRNSYELAFRNQFYTPDYVVAFLTDNTLGRLWYEMRRGETRLVERCRYLIRRPNEVFLDPPDAFLPRECRGWVRQVRSGDFSHLPDDPAELELASISLAFDGYEVAQRLGGYGDLLVWAGERLERFEETGDLPPSSLDRWLIMFALQREWRIITGSGPVAEDFLDLWQRVYLAWREALQAETSGGSEGDLSQRPVYRASRSPRDPRELRILDPACGSGHFLLYTFDLLMTIYEEAWASGWIPAEEFGAREDPVLLHETVQPDPAATPISNYSGERAAFDDAYIVITNKGDFGDGVDAGQPYLVSSAQRFRVPFDCRVKLSEFDYSAALDSGLFDKTAGERLVRDTSAFLFEELPAVGKEEAAARFRRQIPQLILEHNLYGVDIDLRAVQIAELALWLRAQRAYGEMDVKMSDRPRIERTNVACAEPMPGEYDLLGEFTRDLKPAVLGKLVFEIWDKMKLADEAGSLLKIEREIEDGVRQAQQTLASLPPGRQLRLFGPEQPEQMQLRPSELDDEAFWAEAGERVIEALRSYAHRTGNGRSVTRQLFAREAEQGIAFVDVMRRRYDLVLMNPPFGAASEESKAYIKEAYPRTKNDLYAAFVERGLELLREQGYLGTITSRTGFFLSSFQKWREEILLGEAQMVAMADLGQGVLDTAMVKTAAYVLRKAEATND